MCHYCNQHGDRDHKWYEKVENYLFNKVFRSLRSKKKSNRK